MADTTIQTEILIHDLKVPISVIDAGAKSLLNRQDTYGPLTDKQIKVLKRIIRNTLTTQRLVNDVLELGRSREGVMNYADFSISSLVTAVLVEVFDLADPNAADIIRKIRDYDALLETVDQVGVGLDFSKIAWESVICQDPAKVRQILRNLVTNALKHRIHRIEIRGNLADKKLVLQVRDDGRGIPLSDHQKIFKTYFTTGGSIESAISSHGLGLAGVMMLLKDMGGHLCLNSEPGRGAEFIVEIPLC